MLGFGSSVVRAAAGAVAHVGWWLAWQTRAGTSEACVETTERSKG